MEILTDGSTNVRVSSVLNRDTKQFGKKHLFDGEDDTCWNSDQGSPQWLQIELGSEAQIKELKIRFQGGFAGRECHIDKLDHNEPMKVMDFYPEDINSLQSFVFPEETRLRTLKIVFNNSTDFFGRITIYELKVLGVQGS